MSSLAGSGHGSPFMAASQPMSQSDMVVVTLVLLVLM